MNIIKEIERLNFLADEYVVVGGASMAARGIKETGDIDIVATPGLFKRCRKEGWQEHPRPNGESGLEKGVVEMYLDVNCGNFNPTFADLCSRAEIIEGIPFCSLEDVRRFKKEYNREKDVRDIELIEEYLRRGRR